MFWSFLYIESACYEQFNNFYTNNNVITKIDNKIKLYFIKMLVLQKTEDWVENEVRGASNN